MRGNGVIPERGWLVEHVRRPEAWRCPKQGQPAWRLPLAAGSGTYSVSSCRANQAEPPFKQPHELGRLHLFQCEQQPV